MKCEECEYRFRCWTLAENERPKRVKVNWKVSSQCGKCRHSKFPTTTKSGRGTPATVGLCELHSILVHVYSATCDDYEPKKTMQADKVYRELREALNTKNRKTKLPKYCVIEE